jgi:DNA primase
VTRPLADDREELLERVDLMALFAERGLVRKPGSGWPCPNPAHAQSGATPPVSIGVVDGRQLWNCHGCGAGGSAVDLLVLLDGATQAEAFTMLRERVGVASPRPTPAPRPTPIADASRPFDDAGATLTAFLERRGWRPEVADRFGLHAVRGRDVRIRFPFCADDQVMTWQDRAITDQGPKFLAATGRPLCLYASDLAEELEAIERSRCAILLEGPPDVIALAHAFPGGALALPGANNLRACRVGPTLASLDVIVAMDNDPAGEAAREALTTELHAHRCRVAHLRYPDHVKDLDDWRRSLDCDDTRLGDELLERLDELEWVRS